MTRLHGSILLCAAAAAAAFVLLSAAYAPQLDVNALRIAPACALAHGLAVYATAARGIVTGYMYPPLSIVAFFPVAWMRDASRMVAAADFLAAAYYLAPAALFAGLLVRRFGVSRADAAAFFAALLLWSAFDPATRYALTMVHVDAPALGLAGLAWLAAAFGSKPAGARWAAAGALGVAAILCKQTLIPAWLALGLAAAFLGGRGALLRYVGGSAAVAAAFAAWLTIFGNWPALFYDCVTIPRSHPWDTSRFAFTFGSLPTGQDAVSRLRLLANNFIYLSTRGWLVAPALWCAVKLRSGSPLLRAAALAAWMGLAQFPPAALVLCKVGAGENSLAPPLYLLALSAVALASHLYTASASRSRAPMSAVLVVLLLCNTPRLGFLAHAVATRSDPNAPMVAWLRDHPGETYLPWSPLPVWIAEGRQYHYEDGIFDRALARRPVGPELYRSGMPVNLRWVAIRRSQPSWSYDMFRHYLPGLIETPPPPGLESWVFYRYGGEDTPGGR